MSSNRQTTTADGAAPNNRRSSDRWSVKVKVIVVVGYSLRGGGFSGGDQRSFGISISFLPRFQWTYFLTYSQLPSRQLDCIPNFVSFSLRWYGKMAKNNRINYDLFGWCFFRYRGPSIQSCKVVFGGLLIDKVVKEFEQKA